MEARKQSGYETNKLDLDAATDYNLCHCIGLVCISLCRDGGGCLYAVIQAESRATPEQ